MYISILWLQHLNFLFGSEFSRLLFWQLPINVAPWTAFAHHKTTFTNEDSHYSLATTSNTVYRDIYTCTIQCDK